MNEQHTLSMKARGKQDNQAHGNSIKGKRGKPNSTPTLSTVNSETPEIPIDDD